MPYDDVIAAKIDEMCSRVLKLNQHPYLSMFVGAYKKHVMKPDEKYIVASNDQWEETISKEKSRGALYFVRCYSCRFTFVD